MCTGGDPLGGVWSAEIYVAAPELHELTQGEIYLNNALKELGTRGARVKGISGDQGRQWRVQTIGRGKDIVDIIQALRGSLQSGSISVHVTWKFEPDGK